MRQKLYVLKNNIGILAISEELMDIAKYIDQFESYFVENQYEITEITDRIKVRQYLSMYREKYLHYFTNDIILTDMEITYYHKEVFGEIYENMKIMISQSYLNLQLIKMDAEEIELNTKFSDMMYEKIHSYQMFLDSMRTEEILRRYICKPLDAQSLETIQLLEEI